MFFPCDQIPEFINGDFTIKELALKHDCPIEDIEHYFHTVFDMSSAEVYNAYRKQTDCRARSFAGVHVSRIFRPGRQAYIDKTHHATRESKAMGSDIARFVAISPVIKLTVNYGTEVEIDLDELTPERVDSHSRYTTVMTLNGANDQSYEVGVEILDFRTDMLDLYGIEVRLYDKDFIAPFQPTDGAIGTATVRKNVAFFLPEQGRQADPESESGFMWVNKKLDTTISKETIMSTKVTPEIISDIAVLLMETKTTIRDLLDDLKIADQPKFYAEFRKAYGCTPTEYRVAAQDQEAVEHEAKEEEVIPWDFTVLINPEAMQLGFGDSDPGLAPPLNVDFKITIVVNEAYPFLVYLVNRAGTCPFYTNKDLIRSEYRDVMHDQVLETLKPYFHGRLDIAYCHTLKTNAPPTNPSQWPGHSPFSPGPGHGYPR